MADDNKQEQEKPGTTPLGEQQTKTGDATGPQDGKQEEKPSEGQNGGKVEFTKEQQAYLDKLVGDARKEGRESAKKELDAAKAKADEEAETAALKEQKKFEDLAEKRQKKVEEHEAALTDLTAKFEVEQKTSERYKSALEEFLKKQREGLPEHIIALLDKLDPVDQLEYIAQNAEAIKTTTSARSGPGTPSRGMPSKQASGQQKQEQPEIRKPLFKL